MEQVGTYPVEASLSVSIDGEQMDMGAGRIMVPVMFETDKDGMVSYTPGGTARALADFLRSAADRLEQEDNEGEAE